MNINAIYHRSQDNWCFPYDDHSVELRIRTGLEVTKVVCEYGDQHDGTVLFSKWKWKSHAIEMKRSGQTAHHAYWTCIVTPSNRRMKYHFILSDDHETLVFGETSVLPPNEEPDNFNYFFFPYFHRKERYLAPTWVKDTVWYQIFPDRFANHGNKGFKAWHNGPVKNSDHYGGNLKGILEQLDYLKDLGISGIYLTPVFASPTTHKYDTQDYFTIDPDFGTKEDLIELVKQAHRRGIKVMLDAVFNHAGDRFEKWMDVKNNPDSNYRDWFFLDEKNHYETFAFAKNMPKLNTENPDVIDYFCTVGKYWIETADIDGWRLDVANEISHTFWRAFRSEVRSVKPDVYILGEVWHDAMPWLQGDQFDAVMNYPYTKILLDLIAHGRIDLSEFRAGIDEIRNHYPTIVQANQFNLFDSHDTARLTTLCKNDLTKVKGALAFLLVSPGSPCIYYGTEIAMEGGNDPDCRRLMQWNPDPRNHEMFNLIQAFIQLRKDHPVLSNDGDWKWIETSKNIIAFTRSNADETLSFYYNPTTQPVSIGQIKGESLYGSASTILEPGQIQLIKEM